MSANVPVRGDARRLGRVDESPMPLTERDVQDPTTLARILVQIRNDVQALRRKWAPRHIDFEDVTVDATGTTKYRFAHGFGGRVRYWPVYWTGTAAPILRPSSSSTTNDVLVLVSGAAGTMTLRVEEAG